MNLFNNNSKIGMHFRRMDDIIRQKDIVSSSFPGFAYDVWQTFESALGTNWSESSDPGSVLNPQDATAAMHGTYGMSTAAGSTSEVYVLWDSVTSYSSITVGFLYKTGTYSNFSGGRWVCRFGDDAEGQLLVIMDGRSAGDNSRIISWNLDSDSVTVNNETWYWITARFVQNGTCECAVYNWDTSTNSLGAQVGSTMSATGSNFNVDSIWWGTYGVSSSTICFFDDLFINYSTAPFPLLPS